MYSIMSLAERIIHFDTIDGIPNYDQDYANRNIALGTATQYCFTQTFNTSIPISVPVQNAKSISLKMVEFPFTPFTVRNSNGSDSFTFTFNYGAYVNKTRICTLTNMTHLSLASLLSDLNTAIAAAIWTASGWYSGFYITFSQNPDDYTKLMCKIGRAHV